MNAVGIRVAGGVQPIARLMLAVGRGGQQAIDGPLVGVGAGVGEKGGDGIGGGRQAGEVEGDAAQEGGFVGLWGRGEGGFLEACEDE